MRTIVEVGAADGTDTVRYARRFPDAIIHAFEPMNANCTTIVAAVRAARIEKRVRLHKVALTDRESTADFWLSGGTTPSGEKNWAYSNSLLPPKDHLQIFPWCTFAKVEIETARLDQILPADPVIDFMHIDVQGAELLVLEGAGNLLKATKSIWLEVSHREMYEGQPLANEVDPFLRKAGFELALDNLGPQGICGDQLWIR